MPPSRLVSDRREGSPLPGTDPAGPSLAGRCYPIAAWQRRLLFLQRAVPRIGAL